MAAWFEREDDLESSLNRNALWAVTYGDLMSYLVIFFMVLYAAMSSRSVALQLGLQGVEEQFGKESQVVGELFSRHGVQRIARIEVGEDRMRIVFLEPVLFDAGRADLKPESLPALERLSVALAELPNPIQVEGHTDDRPLGPGARFASNWELSSARAFAVLRFLERQTVPSRRLSAIGYGEFRPVKPNDSPESRAANRRIEINVLRRRG